MMVDLLEAETAVTARTRTFQIQVDVYLGVTKGASTAIADGLPIVDHVNWDIVYEGHGTKWIWLELHDCLLKTGTAGGARTGLLVG